MAIIKWIKKLFKNKKEMILLGLIFIAGLILRIYRLNPVYISSDHVQWVYASLNIFNNRSLVSNNVSENLIAGIFGFPYGFVCISSLYIFACVLSLFNIPLTEITMSLPVAVFGSFTIIGVYLVGKEYGGKKVGVVAAFLLAIEPLHVTQSRDVGRMHTIPALFLGIFTIYFFTRYFITKQKRDAILGSSFLGVYLGSSNMAIGMLPLIFYIGLCCGSDKHKLVIEKIVNTFSQLFKKEIVIIPVLLIAPYVLAQLYGTFCLHNPYAGFWGKTLLETKVPGIYVLDLIHYYIQNCGYLLVLIFPFGAYYGLKKFLELSKEGILFFWVLIYAFPFLFLAPPYATGIRLYILESEIGLEILSVMAFFSLYSSKKMAFGFVKPMVLELIMAVIFIMTCMVTFSWVFNLKLNAISFLGLEKDMGTLDWRDTGIKTAGYYIRENVNLEDSIFTDAELFLSNYYFGRKIIYSSYDYNTTDEIANYLKKIQSGVDVVVISKENENWFVHLMDKVPNTFFKNVEISVDNEIRRVIYSRHRSPMVRLEAAKYNRLFDYKYGKLKRLIPELAPWPQPDKPIPKANRAVS